MNDQQMKRLEEIARWLCKFSKDGGMDTPGPRADEAFYLGNELELMAERITALRQRCELLQQAATGQQEVSLREFQRAEAAIARAERAERERDEALAALSLAALSKAKHPLLWDSQG